MRLNKEKYIGKIKKGFNIAKIEYYLEKLKSLKVLVIGDAIIDEYVFVATKGRAIKDPILSVGYRNHEIYAGGVLSIARH